MLNCHSFMSQQIQSFINYQTASVHWKDSSYCSNLLLFDRYCEREFPEADRLTQEMVDRRCHKRDTETNNSCRSRISVVLCFIRYLQKREWTDIILPEIPRQEKSSYIPHAFSNKELERFFDACDHLSRKAKKFACNHKKTDHTCIFPSSI